MFFREKISVLIILIFIVGCVKSVPKQSNDVVTINQLVMQAATMHKALIEQAKRDNVSVSDEDVEVQLNNRIDYFIKLYGSKEKMEDETHKTMQQIKDDNREAIREQMIAEKEQILMLGNDKTNKKK